MKKIAITSIVLFAVAGGMCFHMDPDTGEWGFALPGMGPDRAAFERELHDLLGDESSTDVVPRMEELVRKGARLDSRNPGDREPIHLAVFGGHADAVQWLLDQGVPVDVRSGDDTQPIHEAAIEGDLAIVKVLLDAGASPNATTSTGMQAMHYAAMGDNVEVVKLLIAAGGAVDGKDEDGRTPYRCADVEAIRELLVENGAKRPKPTLREAHRLGRELSQLWLTADGPEDLRARARKLLERGAKPDVAVEGIVPMHFLLEHAELVKLLLANGASVETRDDEGRPALLVAVSDGHYDTARVLLENGASPKATDRHGVTPLEIADGRMLELLKKY